MGALRAILIAGVVAAASPAVADTFSVPMDDGGVFLNGVIETNEFGELVVESAWLRTDTEILPVWIGAPDLIGYDGFGEWLGVGWASFEVHQLTDDLLFIISDSTPYPGQPRQPWDRFFVSLIQGDPGEWEPDQVMSIDKIEAEVAEQADDSDAIQAAGSLFTPPPCIVPHAPPGTLRFIVRLSEATYVVIIVHPDGTVEMIIFSQDLDGCWFVGDLPTWWERPFIPIEGLPVRNGDGTFVPPGIP